MVGIYEKTSFFKFPLNLLWYSLETFSSDCVFEIARTCFIHSLLLYIDRFKIKCIYNIFFQNFYQIPDLKKETQTKLDDYFSDPFGDEDNEDLLKVMDEIDGVQEKKIKLDS